jgi:hypothetical protein
MPRNSSGVYVLPQAAFIPNTTISSSAVNSDLSDLANEITFSLATTGVSSMTGQLKAASGAANAPGISFASATNTGFYLAGTNQIGWSSAGVLGATFNNDQSVSWSGNASWSGGVTFNGAAIHNGTTTFNTLTYLFGIGSATAFITGLQSNAAIEFVIDGFGATISPGQKGHLEVPFNCTIKRATLLADQVGSIAIGIWKTSFAGFPPTSGSSIVAAAPPTIAGAQSAQDSTLAGWLTNLSAGDILAYNVNSATTITRLTISLLVQRTGQ